MKFHMALIPVKVTNESPVDVACEEGTGDGFCRLCFSGRQKCNLAYKAAIENGTNDT